MSKPVSSIRNLGPASDDVYRKAGIESAEQLIALGPDAAYARLLATGHRPHFIAYYAMVMGLMGRPWNDCQGEEKKELRARFDTIRAANAPSDSPGIEAILNEIGVVEPGDRK